MKTIQQKITFNAKPSVLYNLYMDAKKHSAITGDTAKVSQKVGGTFSAYGNYITGKNIALVKDKMIVQTWRASDWKKSDPDSIFMLYFTPVKGGTEVQMVHANVPDNCEKSLAQGWKDYYWKPWKEAIKK